MLDEGNLADRKGVVGPELWNKSARSHAAMCELRTVHTLIRGSIDIWRDGKSSLITLR